MREESICLGSAPALEECVGIGTRDAARAWTQARAFVEAIRKVCGREPEAARLVIQSRQYEHGTGYEVACVYDPDDEWAAAYAARVEGFAPRTWAEAGMTAPPARSLAR